MWMDEWAFTVREWDPGLHDADCVAPPISSRLKLYPQMATNPIQGHPTPQPPGALVLVAVSVGETAGKAGPVCGLGQPSKGNSRSPSCSFT